MVVVSLAWLWLQIPHVYSTIEKYDVTYVQAAERTSEFSVVCLLEKYRGNTVWLPVCWMYKCEGKGNLFEEQFFLISNKKQIFSAICCCRELHM